MSRSSWVVVIKQLNKRYLQKAEKIPLAALDRGYARKYISSAFGKDIQKEL